MTSVKRDKTEYSKWVSSDLHDHRAKLGLTQAQMGAKIGISPRMYRFYEGGRTPISLSMEYAYKYLTSNYKDAENNGKNLTLGNKQTPEFTKFERERMERLKKALLQSLKDGEDRDLNDLKKDKKYHQFEFMLRMCRQAIKEFDNILSK